MLVAHSVYWYLVTSYLKPWKLLEIPWSFKVRRCYPTPDGILVNTSPLASVCHQRKSLESSLDIYSHELTVSFCPPRSHVCILIQIRLPVLSNLFSMYYIRLWKRMSQKANPISRSYSSAVVFIRSIRTSFLTRLWCVIVVSSPGSSKADCELTPLQDVLPQHGLWYISFYYPLETAINKSSGTVVGELVLTVNSPRSDR
jgi:hypothetical protein